MLPPPTNCTAVLLVLLGGVGDGERSRHERLFASDDLEAVRNWMQEGGMKSSNRTRCRPSPKSNSFICALG